MSLYSRLGWKRLSIVVAISVAIWRIALFSSHGEYEWSDWLPNSLYWMEFDNFLELSAETALFVILPTIFAAGLIRSVEWIIRGFSESETE
jgi:hypothetical protein